MDNKMRELAEIMRNHRSEAVAANKTGAGTNIAAVRALDAVIGDVARWSAREDTPGLAAAHIAEFRTIAIPG